MPTPTHAEIAAWIGAAAWAPQIAGWIYLATLRPRLRMIPAPTMRLGYSITGPYIEANISICAERRDAIIQRMTLDMRHEKGQSSSLLWSRLSETISQIRGVTGETAEVGKSQPALALKVGTASLVERSISFLDPDFQQRKDPLINAVVDIRNHFQKTDPDNFKQRTLTSKPLADLLDFYRKNVFWQQGTYTASIRVHAIELKTPVVTNVVFSLTGGQADRLNRNPDAIDYDIKEAISPTPKDQQQKPVLYDWIDVSLRST